MRNYDEFYDEAYGDEFIPKEGAHISANCGKISAQLRRISAQLRQESPLYDVLQSSPRRCSRQ